MLTHYGLILMKKSGNKFFVFEVHYIAIFLENKPTLQIPIIQILFTNGLEDVIQVLYPSSKNPNQILVHPISKINSSFFLCVIVTFCLHDYIPKKKSIV